MSFVIETLKSGDSILWDSLSSEFKEMAIKQSAKLAINLQGLGKFRYTPEKFSQRSFIQGFVAQDGVKEGVNPKERMSGGAGTWGYKVDIEPVLVPQINHALMAEQLCDSYIENQLKIIEIYEQEKSLRRFNVDYPYVERFDPKYTQIWQTLLGKRVHPTDRLAYKDMDLKLEKGQIVPRPDSNVKRGQLPAFLRDEVYQDLKVKAFSTCQLIFGNENRIDPDVRFLIQIVDKDELDETRRLDEVSENGHVAKLILIREGYEIKSMEMWFNHFNSNEEQGRRLLEKILSNENIKPIENTNFDPKVLRRNENGENIVYDIETRFKLDKELEEKTLKARNLFEPPMSLSTFLILANLIDNPDVNSGYICIETDKKEGINNPSAELQMALVPVSRIIKKIASERLTQSTAKQLFNEFVKLNNFVSKDTENAKKGKGLLSVLFVEFPDLFKTVLGTIFKNTNKTLKHGGVQISSIKRGSEKFDFVDFITAINSTVNTGISVRRGKGNKVISLRQRLTCQKDEDNIEKAKEDAIFMQEAYKRNIELLADIIVNASSY